jgi:hypothetical protein
MHISKGSPREFCLGLLRKTAEADGSYQKAQLRSTNIRFPKTSSLFFCPSHPLSPVVARREPVELFL